jgi:hypothetical protein
VTVALVVTSQYKNATKKNANVALAIIRVLLEEIDDRVLGMVSEISHKIERNSISSQDVIDFCKFLASIVRL